MNRQREGGNLCEYDFAEHQMSEEDIKLQYIPPATLSKWDQGKSTMETQITDGKINLKGNFAFREKPKRADYVLYFNASNPIAVVEAKDNKNSISHGLQQAMTYDKQGNWLRAQIWIRKCVANIQLSIGPIRNGSFYSDNETSEVLKQ